MSSLGRGEGVSSKDYLLNRPSIINKRQKGQKCPILRRHSLWTALNNLSIKSCNETLSLKELSNILLDNIPNKPENNSLSMPKN